MSPTASEEKYLTLADGRTLAYDDNGNPSSSTVILFFHGVYGVGKATNTNTVFQERGFHYIAPTLAGWGLSTPAPRSIPLPARLSADIAELIEHLHPCDTDLKLYLGGGSYGTVFAQVLYGAPFDIFPLGRRVLGCFLAAPFTPFRWHKEYAKSMTWQNYLSVGPPSQIIPFRLLPRLLAIAIGSKMKTVESTEVMLREILFDPAREEERAAYAAWREKKGMAEGELERNMAKNALKSVATTKIGFLEVSDTLHSDWGFRPDQLDEEHSRRPVLVAASTHDELGADMANWLKATYKNAHLRWIEGGHLSSLYVMDDLWKEFIELTEAEASPPTVHS